MDLWVLKQKRKGGESIGRRTRPFAYNFRASEQEKNLIDNAIVKSGLTITDFVIRSIIDKPITVLENGNEILAELKRQGNNLNQITRNSYNGLATEEEIRSCIAKQNNGRASSARNRGRRSGFIEQRTGVGIMRGSKTVNGGSARIVANASLNGIERTLQRLD